MKIIPCGWTKVNRLTGNLSRAEWLDLTIGVASGMDNVDAATDLGVACLTP